MATRFYIDGYNLYYGLLKDRSNVKSGAKWLDLHRLACRLMPKEEVDRVYFFTARVSSPASDPGLDTRQDTYLRALATNPKVTVVEGKFVTRPRRLFLADGTPNRVEVLVNEEKGSDVNLATHLVADGFRGSYDKAVVVSNDSDLVTPIRLVKEELGRFVRVLSPHRSDKASKDLVSASSHHGHLHLDLLLECQLPNEVEGPTGTIRRPASW